MPHLNYTSLFSHVHTTPLTYAHTTPFTHAHTTPFTHAHTTPFTHTHLTQLDLRPAGKIILQVKLYGKPAGMKQPNTNSNLTLIIEVHNLIQTLIYQRPI